MPQRLLMHSSLWLLLRMGFLARLRALRGFTKTWKGRIVLVLMLGGLGMWLVGSVIDTSGRLQLAPETVRTTGALALGAMILSTVLLGGSEGGVVFRPAEVEFLFPAPIPRRQLLVYRIVSLFLMTLPTSLFLAVSFQRHSPMFCGAWLGTWFSFGLLSLVQTAWQLVAGIAEQNTIARSRKGLLFLLALIVVAAFVTGSLGTRLSLSTVTEFADSGFARKLLAPLLPFTSVFVAADYPELLKWSGVCLTILLAIVFLILRLDVNHSEASLAASQRMAKRVSDARSGKIVFNKGNAFLQRFAVPTLPRLGGAGPIAWHQLTSLLRSAGNLAFFLVILGTAMMAPIAMSGSVVVKQVLVLMTTMSVFLLPQFIQYDFRSEVDRMAVLKALPLSPMAICCGELLAPILATLIVQLIMLGLVMLMGGSDPRVLQLTLAFLLPVDILIFAVENFVFLMFPFRSGPSAGQDLQNMIRVMLTMMCKFLLIGVCVGVAGGFGGLCYYLTENVFLSCAIAWLITLACCAGLLPALAWAFQRFDPATDTPG